MSKLKINYPENKSFNIGRGERLSFILGPCAIESEMHALKMAELICNICQKKNVNFIYKSCYDKDCRSSINSFYGVGITNGLKILSKIKNEFKIPVTTDFSIHSEAPIISEVCDLIQVPAYLCRQSSILKSAAQTGKPVHLKKGQFMSPWNMKNSVLKLESFGCTQMLLTDRGTFFGYNMLINDMRSLPIMAETNYPVCFDATHSVQMPTSMGNISGGQREFIPHLVRSAVACGVNAVFMEVHDDPQNALSDKNTVLDIKYLDRIIDESLSIHKVQLELEKKYGREYIHN